MKNSAYIILVIMFLSSTNPAFSESTSVKINNRINVNNNSTTETNTEIRINQNGKITEYSSDKYENIEINSVNGQSEIKINDISISSSPTPTPNTIEVSENKKIYQEKKENLINEIILKIKNSFPIFEKIFSIF